MKTKEELEIGDNESQEKKVKDLTFRVNTMTSGIVSFNTEIINGILEGIFVDSQKQIQLKVNIGDSDITIFEIQSFQGEQFIPIRLGVVDDIGASFRGVADKWALNDKLRFDIKGPLNSEIKFVVRYI